MQRLTQGGLPKSAGCTRELLANLIATIFSALGKEFSGTFRVDTEIHAYADALSDMFSAWIMQISSCHGFKASLMN